jgi:hypothetical protein
VDALATFYLTETGLEHLDHVGELLIVTLPRIFGEYAGRAKGTRLRDLIRKRRDAYRADNPEEKAEDATTQANAGVL